MGTKLETEYIPTIGADLSIIDRKINIKSKNYDFQFYVWDLAGQQIFSVVRPRYYQGSNAAVLVYDISNRDSFNHIQNWVNELIKHNRDFPLPLALIANKSDLKEQVNNPIITSEGKNLAQIYSEKFNQDVFFLETSALTGENVNIIFEKLAKILISNSQYNFIQD